MKTRMPTLWTNSHFVSKVGGAPLDVIKQYIENQKTSQRQKELLCVMKSIKMVEKLAIHRLPKLGFVKVRQSMEVGKIKNVTIECAPTGKYFAVLNVKFESQTKPNEVSISIYIRLHRRAYGNSII